MSLTVRGPGMSVAGLRASQALLDRSIGRLSSGLRVGSAADDAAGLALSEGLRSQVMGSAIALRNVSDGISMLQTAEGGLGSITSALQRIRDLSVQAASTGGLSADGRAAAAAEVAALVTEIDRTATSTAFSGQRLLDGSRSGMFAFHVGAGRDDVLTARRTDVRASTLGLAAVPPSTVTTTTSSTTTTWTTSSAALPAVFTTQSNANREFVFSVGSDAPVSVMLRNNRDYSVPAYLASDLQTRIDAAGLDVDVLLTSNTDGDPIVEFRAGDPSRTVTITGSAAAALGVGVPDPTSTSSSTTTVLNVPGSTSLADLVADGSADAITTCDVALGIVLEERAQTGALQNRLEHRLSVLSTTSENLATARARITDADMAVEWAGVVRGKVRSQAGTAIQAQAVADGQRVVQLLTAR